MPATVMEFAKCLEVDHTRLWEVVPWFSLSNQYPKRGAGSMLSYIVPRIFNLLCVCCDLSAVRRQ